MKSKTRTVRFDANEVELISRFLKANPFLDFSSLTRIAVAEFIRNPKLQVNPITRKKLNLKKLAQGGTHV